MEQVNSLAESKFRPDPRTQTSEKYSMKSANLEACQQMSPSRREKPVHRCQLHGSSRRSMTLPHSVATALLFCILTTWFGPAEPADCPTACVCPELPSAHRLNSTRVVGINCSAAGLSVIPSDMASWEIPDLTDDNSTNRDGAENATLKETLEFLDLSRNSLSSAAWFDTNETRLRVLRVDLSYNDIRSLGPGDLSVFAHVTRQFDLSHNQLQDVHPDAFQDLTSIMTLNLSHNAIYNLHNDTFRNLPNLLLLDLSHNLFKENVMVPILRDLSSLYHLYLNNNLFTNLTIPRMRHLSVLDLSHNELVSVPAFIPDDLPSLKTLNMSHNSIRLVHQTFFTEFKQLTHLNLDNNPLQIEYRVKNHTSTHLHSSSISLLPKSSQLIYLNMSHTPHLDFIPPTLFTYLHNLQVLDLSYSNVSHLSEITFHGLQDLTQLYLRGNPFNCSCINAWMSKLNLASLRDATYIQCLSHDGSLSPISLSSDFCEDVAIHNTTDSDSVRLGSQLLLQCHVSSSSPSLIEWQTPQGQILLYHAYHPAATHHLPTPESVRHGSHYHSTHHWHNSSSYHSELADWIDRIIILSDGSLYLDYILRSDAGPYTCRASNARYNETSEVVIYIHANIGDIRTMGFVVGFLCAAAVFTLNGIYVFCRWLTFRLVNKRRRETIRQLLESINVYKSTQMTRIQDNYSHQLSRVRNQYNTQCDRLHKNYTHQVTRVRRGCSHQVDRVRDNYQSKLSALREYTSIQVVQIRDRANNQIVRIRDYGSNQLEGLRETFKLQQQHVIKLLDTVNLDNCRSIIESECMHTESMIFNLDLLADEEEGDSVASTGQTESEEYNTPGSSPDSVSHGVDNPLIDVPLSPEFIQLHDSQLADDSDSNNLCRVEDNSVYIEMKMPNSARASSRDAIDVEASEARNYGKGNESPEYFISLHRKDQDLTCQDCKTQRSGNHRHKLRHGANQKDRSFKSATQLTTQTFLRPGESNNSTLESDDDSSSNFETPNTSPIKCRRDYIPSDPRLSVTRDETDISSDKQDENNSLLESPEKKN